MKRLETIWRLYLVMVSALLSLTVPNPASAASNADYAAENRYQAEAKITTEPNGSITFSSFSHPGKIIVIEFVSGTCQTNQYTKIFQIGIQTVANGVEATHRFVPVLLFSTGDANYYAISQRTRIYSDATSSIGLNRGVHVAVPGPEVINCSIVISGYWTQ
jgi:hypothetical protein